MKNLAKNQDKRIEFGISCLIMLWAAIAFWGMQSVTFETNDDNSMARMAYGMLGSYETHLVYINVFVGQCLKFCLTLFPTIPWYTVFQCGIALISFFVIVYLFLCRFGVRKGLIPSFVLLFFFGAEFFLKLQFSKTAGIASLAGLLLIFDSVTSGGGRIWKTVLGAVLTVLGSMYRFNVFCMMLIPFFGIGLFIISKPLKERNWKALLRICVPFLVIFALCFAFRVYDSRSYSTSPEWSGYKEFNSLRSKLTDYGFPDYEENQQLYESLNISESDLAVYKRWDFADSEVVTTDTLRKLVDAKPEEEISKSEGLQAVMNFLLNYRYSMAMFIAMAVGLVMPKKRSQLLLAYVVLAIAGIQVYMFCNGRYGTNRIDVSLACALFVIITLYTWGNIEMPNRWLIGVMTALILFAPFSEYDFSNTEPDAEEPVIFYALAATDKDHLYVRTTVTDIAHLPRPTEIYPVGYMENCVALGGWATNTGTYHGILDSFGVTNLYRDLVDNPDLYLVANDSYLKSRISYIRRNYASKASAYPVKVTEDGHSIYRVSTAPGPVIDVADAIPVEGQIRAHYDCGILADEEITLNGYFYLDNNNSFASSIYYSLTNDAGNETLYYATQHYSDAFGDLMNGEYASFSAVLPEHSDTDQLKLYLQINDSLYCVSVGTVGRIINSGR